MKELRRREIKTAIITTKGKIFAEQILKQLNIFHRPAKNYANTHAFHRLLLHQNQIKIFFEKTLIK